MKAAGKVLTCFLGLLAMAGGGLAASEDSTTNPYTSIADRNAFGLSTQLPPTPATASAPASNAAPGLRLTGIVDFSARKWALLASAEIGKPARNYTLREGEARDGLEVLDIDGVNGNVRIRYCGAEFVLVLAAPDTSRKETLAVEKQLAEERARADELLQMRERAQLKMLERAQLDYYARAIAAAGWDSATNQALAHPIIQSATFSPDGKLVMTSDGSDSVRVWDVTTGQPIPFSGGVHGATFAPDGQPALPSNGNPSVRVWDSSTGQLLGTQR